jgi:flagellar biosynthesis protein
VTVPRSEIRPRAVALAYGASDVAPRVLAKGRGATAESIIERARESGIYVHESPELVSLLMHLDLDARIPQSLYRAVAELLAWIYRLEQRTADGSGLAEPPDKGG